MEKMEFEKHKELTDFIQEMASTGQAPRQWSMFLEVLNKALSQHAVISSFACLSDDNICEKQCDACKSF